MYMLYANKRSAFTRLRRGAVFIKTQSTYAVYIFYRDKKQSK